MTDSGLYNVLIFDNTTSTIRVIFNAVSHDGTSSQVMLMEATDPDQVFATYNLTLLTTMPNEEVHISVIDVPSGYYGNATQVFGLLADAATAASSPSRVLLYDSVGKTVLTSWDVRSLTPPTASLGASVSTMYADGTSATFYSSTDGSFRYLRCDTSDLDCRNTPSVMLMNSTTTRPGMAAVDALGRASCLFYDYQEHDLYRATCTSGTSCSVDSAAVSMTGCLEACSL